MSGKQMKRLRKAAKRIADFSAKQNKMNGVPEGYDTITSNTAELLMHKEGSVKHIYKTLKKIK